MLPIPKDLLGSIVEPFINYDNPSDELKLFLRQVFEHAMIPVYFEGWKITKDAFLKGEGWVDFCENTPYSIMKFERDNNIWINGEPCLATPEILDQLVSDCLRKRIKLIWKKE